MVQSPIPPRAFRLADTVLDLPLGSLFDVARWQKAFVAWGIDFERDGVLTVADFQRLYPEWSKDARQLAWSIMRMKPMIVEIVE
jgi:hypothetical protein